jgi:sodium-dependent dicarboxylate transporter 2/3/5
MSSARRRRPMPLKQIDQLGREIIELSPTFFKFFAKLPSTIQRSIKVTLPFGVLALITVLPLDLEPKIQHALATFVCVSLLWTLGGLPLPVTALLVPVLLTFYGIFPVPSDALTPFADPVVFLLMGGLILAAAFRKHGVDRRLAYYVISKLGGDIPKVLLSFMLVAAVLSMWISNTATVALLIPVVVGIAARVTAEKGRLSVLFLIGIGIGSAIGGMATVTGSAPNAVASALIAQQTTWTFVDWMKIGFPTSMMLLVLSWYVLLRVFPVNTKRLDIGPIKTELREMGALTSGEKKTMGVFVPTVILWVAGASIGEIFGFEPGFMSATIVALAAAVLLFLTRTLDWQDARSISWDIFLIIGAGLALGKGLQVSGAAQWMADMIAGATGGITILLVMLVIALVSIALSNFMSNTATAAILAPVLISVAADMGVDLKFLVLACGLSVSLSFITPIGTPPFTLIFSTGMVTRRDLARGGLMVTIPAALVVVLMVFIMVELGFV